MRNIDRLANHITKHGSENIIIHTIPGTSNWLVCQKSKPDNWLISLTNPMGNVTHNLGYVTDKQHLELWEELTRYRIETRATQIELAKDLRKRIYHFIKNYNNRYQKLIKRNKKK